jgi:phage-related protein
LRAALPTQLIERTGACLVSFRITLTNILVKVYLSMDPEQRLLVWLGSSKRDLMSLPVSVRKFFGHALDYAQRGEQHIAAKVLKGFGGAGVLELVEDDGGGTYRAIYTVKFEEAVFVLHAFQKKSKSGIATNKEDLDIIRIRLKAAAVIAQELRNDKANR